MNSELVIRVSYADTDQMGMVYYANYLVYFERGRTEWLREHGINYKKLEDRGVLLPVAESYCKYIAPARYDDILTVKTKVSKLGFASAEFEYEVFRQEVLIMTGWTKHPFVNKEFRPIKAPVEIKNILEKSDAQKDHCCR